MPKEMQFKVSSALKDIIGRDLINDDLIAIFELVKNSYDAHATKVDIYFENLYSNNPSIKIVDNGKGMGFDDLRDKWLFLAYSAKKDGTEDENTDFRDKINTKRAYAGAKGIGRFSCDRLGSKLLLETTKENSSTEILDVDWEKFEEDAKKEFIDISVKHETSREEKEHGTILAITNLRGEWNRKKLLKLKDALAKLINPNQNYDDEFEIYLYSEDEENEDKKYNEYHKRVNGKIVNHIFKTLDLKTTKIITKVFSRNNESIIQTALYEANELVYEIEEVSKYQYLNKLEYIVYYLNQSAKSTFTRRMGIESVGYGHIFVYKNGIRIYPYGEKGEDPLAMDVRKGQGYARYLGTREVIGFINIDGATTNLKETSSRGDGLVKNDAYSELKDLFYETLKRLEKYTISIIDWGKTLSQDYINFDDDRSFNALVDLIKKLADTEDVLSVDYGDRLIKHLKEKEETSASGIIKGIKADLASGKGNTDNLLKRLSQVETTISHIQDIAEKTEKEVDKVVSENLELKVTTEKQKEQVLFLQSVQPMEKAELIKLQHHIGLYAHSIDDTILDFKMTLDEKEMSKKEIVSYLSKISYETQKILAINKYATKANFLKKAKKIEADIVQFIDEYIENIYKIYANNDLKIKVDKNNQRSIGKFEPILISIILDNMFNNSRKAKAKTVEISFYQKDGVLYMDYIDNGTGLDASIASPEDIFEIGITTTDGSGLGMSHVKDSLKKLNKSTIEAIPKDNGMQFTIGFNI